MVLLERIELSTSPLPRVRSTTELQQLSKEGRALARTARLSSTGGCGRQACVNDAKDDRTREERLAAKLRENLRRRKAQARAMQPHKPSLPKEGGNS